MKKTVFLMALLCGMLCAGAAEQLPNPAFQNNFKFWTRRGATAGLKADGFTAVFSGDKKIFLIQYLPVKPGKYVVSYRISGNGKYRAYCENFGKTANGGKFHRSSGTRVLTAPEKEEIRSFAFTIKEEDLPQIQSFGLIFLYVQGQEIRLTAPSLQIDETAQKNANAVPDGKNQR